MTPNSSVSRELGQERVITSPMRGPVAPEVSSPSPMKMTVRFCGTLSNIDLGAQTMRSKKRPCSLCTSLPMITKRSARLRASVSVDMIQPLGLHDFDVAVLAFTQRVVDDAAGAVGQRHHGAGAVDVGGHAAIKRQPGGLDAGGGGGDGRLERRPPCRLPSAAPPGARAGSPRRSGRSRS